MIRICPRWADGCPGIMTWTEVEGGYTGSCSACSLGKVAVISEQRQIEAAVAAGTMTIERTKDQ